MKNLVKYITAIVIFLILLTSCGSDPGISSSILTPFPTPTSVPTPTFSPVRDSEATPVPDITEAPVPTETAEPSLELTPTASPEPTLTPTPEIIITPAPDPLTILRECTYINYTNGLPFAMSHTGSVKFSYDDEITLENAALELVTLSLSELITADGYDFSDAESWYFNGAFQYNEMIYAHYDYFDDNDSSLLLKINPGTFDVKLCIISNNPRKQFSDTFVAVGEYIYYTHTKYSSYGTPTTSIYRTDLDGNNNECWLKGTFNETIPHMSTNGTLIYYTAMDSEDISRLISFDPETQKIKTIAKNIAVVDFLYLLGNYAITSLQNNQLAYYNVTTKVAASLRLTSSSSLVHSAPMTDGAYLYVPVFSHSGSSNTRLLKIDLAYSKIVDDIIISDTYYYCLGIIQQTLYAEDGNSYQIFQLDNLE